MSTQPTPQSWLENTKKTWGLLTQCAVFILGVIGSFVVPPPGWASSGSEKTVVRLGQFIIAILVGLMLLLVQRWNKKKHIGRWVLLALFFLALSISSFFTYQHFRDTRTCQYAEQIVAIGTVFTAHAREYIRTEAPGSTCTSLLDDYTGAAEDIWTRESINKSRYILAATYIVNLPLFTICLIAVVQAVSCSQSRGRRR